MEGRTTLKSYFEKDDMPTQAQFASQIDSVPNILDDGILVGGDGNITAHAGGGQANAYQLTKKVNKVTVCATLGDSVKLPIGVPGMVLHVWHMGSKAMFLYPSSGGQLNDYSIDSYGELYGTDIKMFTCYATNKWYYLL